MPRSFNRRWLQMQTWALRPSTKRLTLNPQAEDAYIELARLYADIGQPKGEGAKALIDRAEANLKREQAMPTIAYCSELMNDLDRAEQKYKAAVKAFPQNSGILRQTAGFYFRRKSLAQAEPLLRAIIALQSPAVLSDICWARRALAGIFLQPAQFRRPLQSHRTT